MEKITAIELTRAIREALVLPSNARQITAARLQSSNGREQVAQRLEERSLSRSMKRPSWGATGR